MVRNCGSGLMVGTGGGVRPGIERAYYRGLPCAWRFGIAAWLERGVNANLLRKWIKKRTALRSASPSAFIQFQLDETLDRALSRQDGVATVHLPAPITSAITKASTTSHLPTPISAEPRQSWPNVNASNARPSQIFACSISCRLPKF